MAAGISSATRTQYVRRFRRRFERLVGMARLSFEAQGRGKSRELRIETPWGPLWLSVDIRWSSASNGETFGEAQLTARVNGVTRHTVGACSNRRPDWKPAPVELALFEVLNGLCVRAPYFDTDHAMDVARILSTNP